MRSCLKTLGLVPKSHDLGTEPTRKERKHVESYFALFDGWVSSTDRQPKSIFASNKETDTNRSEQATVRVR